MENQTWHSSPEMASRLFCRPQEPPPFPSFLSSASRAQWGVPKACTYGIRYPSSPCHPCCLTTTPPSALRTCGVIMPHYLYFHCHKQFMIPSHSSANSCSPNTKTVLHIIFQGQQSTHSQPLNPFHCDIWNTELSAKSPKLSISLYMYLSGVICSILLLLDQRLANVFLKGPYGEYFRLYGTCRLLSQLWTVP